MADTFYDNTPFEYGYSSKEEIVSNMNPNLREIIIENKDKIICDIGCGCGRNLLFTSKYASKLIGVDLSEESLEFAKKFVQAENLELKLGNNLDIPLESNFSDLVISDGVCHHTGDTIGAFKECIRILKPGGSLYLAVYKKYRYYPFLYKYFLTVIVTKLPTGQVFYYVYVYLRYFNLMSYVLYVLYSLFFDCYIFYFYIFNLSILYSFH